VEPMICVDMRKQLALFKCHPSLPFYRKFHIVIIAISTFNLHGSPRKLYKYTLCPILSILLSLNLLVSLYPLTGLG
jgi:hypothetical protein